ncbi:MAG: aspartate carbamoyltransferase [Aggregatilineales bacterium]|nr:aspartate carbamoyltransferase [Chloroflexota bacterium]HPV06277.1 aspartate carbamoyltransferase [Aggregatilineales bacterium]
MQPNPGPVQPRPADHVTNGLYGEDILSVRQFTPQVLEYVFGVADEMRTLVERFGSADLLQGKIMANLFYEPSTRTSSSFMAAMQRLGGQVIPINSVTFSSVSKGESLADTVRTLECYADVIVLRHPEVGAAAEAARWARKPIINAGDGVGEHPTQALLDAYTIRRELDRLEGLTVAMVGDLLYGRTVHSLTRLLINRGNTFRFVSPHSLRMPEELLAEVEAAGDEYTEHEDVMEIIDEADVLYVTRVQKERFTDLSEYDKVNGAYTITPEVMQHAKEEMVVMHPLPRVGEITYEVDEDPRAAYFRQMQNGLYIRMALLAAVLGRA